MLFDALKITLGDGSVLSRCNAVSCAAHVLDDTFSGRSVENGWGTTSDGRGAWTQEVVIGYPVPSVASGSGDLLLDPVFYPETIGQSGITMHLNRIDGGLEPWAGAFEFQTEFWISAVDVYASPSVMFGVQGAPGFPNALVYMGATDSGWDMFVGVGYTEWEYGISRGVFDGVPWDKWWSLLWEYRPDIGVHRAVMWPSESPQPVGWTVELAVLPPEPDGGWYPAGMEANFIVNASDYAPETT